MEEQEKFHIRWENRVLKGMETHKLIHVELWWSCLFYRQGSNTILVYSLSR